MNSKPYATPLSISIRMPHIAGVLLALIMLLNIRRYIGINHDAALYLGQSLLERWPDIFSQDLFFAHGSQGSYTLLPWLISRSFEWAAPGTVFLVGTLVGLLAFAAASWYFIKPLLPDQQRYWAFLGALCLPSVYGVVSIFSYGEPFLTSRPFAEAFSLFGLGLLTRKRIFSGFLFAIAAGLLHPLQTFAACLVAWPWLVMQDRRWLHALWLSVPIAALGFSDIRPFSDLFRPLDPTWLADLANFTRQLFVSKWSSPDYNALCLNILILVFAWRTLPRAFGSWCLAALLGMTLGFTTSLIFVDWLHLILPTALQLWRVQWITQLFAAAAIGALLFRDYKAGQPSRMLCLGLALVLSHSYDWIWLPMAALYAAWPRLFDNTKSRIKPLLGLVCFMGMLALFGIYASNELLSFRMAHYRLELYAIDRRLLIFPLLAMGLPLLGVVLWNHASRLFQLLLVTGVLLPLTILSFSRWDARSPMALAIENHPFQPAMFGPRLPENAQVLWVGVLYPSTWLTLQRADYFSVRQLAGVAFNRGTAMEGRQRLNRVLLALRENLYCQMQPLQEREQCQLDDVAMSNICTPGPTRRPDYVILPYHQPQHAAGQWTFIDPATNQPAMTYWLFDCNRVMDDLAAGMPAARQ